MFSFPNVYAFFKDYNPALHIEGVKRVNLPTVFNFLLKFHKSLGLLLSIIVIYIGLKILRGTPGEFIYFQF